MAHADQFEFVGLVKKHFPAAFEGGRVLEVGSLDINGSVRSFFAAASYTGVDVAAGPGVDQVCQGQLLDYPSGTFDVVISCECMEHNPYWVETVSNIFRMTKAGGLVIVSCATTGRAEHGTSKTAGSDSPLSISIGWDYYRNITSSMFRRSFNLDLWFEDYVLLPNWHKSDLYFVGVRRLSTNGKAIESLRQDLTEQFRPTRSMRSLCVSIAAKSFGELGVNALRAMWRLISRAS